MLEKLRNTQGGCAFVVLLFWFKRRNANDFSVDLFAHAVGRTGFYVKWNTYAHFEELQSVCVALF